MDGQWLISAGYMMKMFKFFHDLQVEVCGRGVGYFVLYYSNRINGVEGVRPLVGCWEKKKKNISILYET